LMICYSPRWRRKAFRALDPDAVIAIDSVDHRAGMALWTRDDLKCHPLLRPD